MSIALGGAPAHHGLTRSDPVSLVAQMLANQDRRSLRSRTQSHLPLLRYRSGRGSSGASDMEGLGFPDVSLPSASLLDFAAADLLRTQTLQRYLIEEAALTPALWVPAQRAHNLLSERPAATPNQLLANQMPPAAESAFLGSNPSVSDAELAAVLQVMNAQKGARGVAPLGLRHQPVPQFGFDKPLAALETVEILEMLCQLEAEEKTDEATGSWIEPQEQAQVGGPMLEGLLSLNTEDRLLSDSLLLARAYPPSSSIDSFSEGAEGSLNNVLLFPESKSAGNSSAAGRRILTAEERKQRRQAGNREAARRLRKRHADRLNEKDEQTKKAQRLHFETLQSLKEADAKIAELSKESVRLEEEVKELRSKLARKDTCNALCDFIFTDEDF